MLQEANAFWICVSLDSWLIRVDMRIAGQITASCALFECSPFW
jgi:hypothetical protein